MKQTRLLLLAILLLLINTVLAQSTKVMSSPPYHEGEELTYKFKYGIIPCAEGTMKVLPGTVNNTKVYHLSTKGETVSAVGWIMKVRNSYDSYIDTKTLLPYRFTESIREGGYKRDSEVDFDHKTKTVASNKGPYPIKENALDVLSMLYYARSLDLTNVKEGDRFTFNFFLNGESSDIEVRYMGVENIKTAFGRVDCMKFTPTVIAGRVFKKSSQMYLWVTNDANRVPVRAEVEILIGSLRLDLTSYKNLKHPK